MTERGGKTVVDSDLASQAAAQWERLKKDIASNTIILPPSRLSSQQPLVPGTARSSKPSCLVIIFPGALQPPQNFLPLAETLSEQSSHAEEELDTWIAIAGCEVLAVVNLLSTLECMCRDLIDVKQGWIKASDPTILYNPPLSEDKSQQKGSWVVPDADSLLMEALLEVLHVCGQAPGLTFQRSPTSGRYLNVVVAGHSMAGCMFTDVAFKCTGATILLESAWSTQFSKKIVQCGWAASSRPIMLLGGQMDGQMAWPSFINDAAISAWTASRQGAVYAATHKSLVLVPGLNHGQMCNQTAMTARGDCETNIPAHVTLTEASKAIMAFLIAHFTPEPETILRAEESLHRSSEEYLIEQSLNTAEFLEAYAMANGLGSLVSTWKVGLDMDCQEEQQSDGLLCNLSSRIAAKAKAEVTDLLSRPVRHGMNVGVPLASGSVCGASPQPAKADFVATLDRANAVGALSHGIACVQSGTVISAELEVVELQLLVAASAVEAGWLTQEAMDTLRIVAHIHTNFESFLQAQPTLYRKAGRARLELQIHAMLHWPLLEKEGPHDPPAWYCASHGIWIKMKQAVSLAVEIRQSLKLPALPLSTYMQEPVVRAAQLNTHVLAWALGRVPNNQRARYEDDGVQLVFESDELWQDAGLWSGHSRMQFTPKRTHDGTNGVSKPDQSPATTPATASRTPGTLVVNVRSPVYEDALQQTNGSSNLLLPPEDCERRAHWGSMFTKVMSRAQAVEWIQLGSVRQHTVPPDAGCRWGGHPVPLKID